MTPLERSRFAMDLSHTAAPAAAASVEPLPSARQWLDSARQNVLSHHGWTSGALDCLGDIKSCCAVLVCFPTALGQLTERVWQTKCSCLFIALFLWIGAVASLYDSFGLGTMACNELWDPEAYSYGEETDYAECVRDYYASPVYVAVAVITSACSVGGCVLLMCIRATLRQRDSIPATTCEWLDDCCCACLCGPCVQCQMMRHVGMKGERYTFASHDGSAFGRLGVMV